MDEEYAGHVVLLASFPRSGNTLFRQVLEQCYGIPTYTMYKTEDKVLWPDRVWPHDAPKKGGVYFLKDHGFTQHVGPIIYIVRDGRDTLLSFWHYQQHTRDLASAMMDGTWAAHVRWYLEQSPVIVKFEDMLADPVAVVRRAIQDAACGYFSVNLAVDPPGHLTDFDTLHEENPEFWRSGTTGQWREALTPEVHEAFWSVNGSAMEALGYER